MPRTSDQNQALRAQARDNIVEAALDVFGANGFDGATTADVAIRAGVSKGLVFNYFPTKQALLQALIERTLGEALGHWEGQDWTGAPAAQLTMLLDAAVDQVCARPHFFRLYFSLVLQPGGSDAVEAAVATLKPRLEAYYGRVAALMTALGSDDPVADAHLFQFALNGLAQAIASKPALLEAPETLPVDALKRRLLARFIP